MVKTIGRRNRQRRKFAKELKITKTGFEEIAIVKNGVVEYKRVDLYTVKGGGRIGTLKNVKENTVREMVRNIKTIQTTRSSNLRNYYYSDFRKRTNTNTMFKNITKDLGIADVISKGLSGEGIDAILKEEIKDLFDSLERLPETERQSFYDEFKDEFKDLASYYETLTSGTGVTNDDRKRQLTSSLNTMNKFISSNYIR